MVGMVLGEVDWIDLLAYCALLVKTPDTVSRIRQNAELIVQDPISDQAYSRRLANREMDTSERLNQILGFDPDPATAELLSYLFPYFSGDKRIIVRVDALYKRRPFLTVLRLGILPGGASREQIEKLLKMKSRAVSQRLKAARKADNLGPILDRLSEVYPSAVSVNHLEFWNGVSLFLKKPDNKWLSKYSTTHEISRQFASLFEIRVSQGETFKVELKKIFNSFLDNDEKYIFPYWVRNLVFGHGLFGYEKRDISSLILDQKEAQAAISRLSKKWRKQYLAGELLPRLWGIQQVYTMLDTGDWDEECRAYLRATMRDDDALEGIALLVFGGHYSVDSATIDKIFGKNKLKNMIHQRMNNSEKSMDGSVQAALEKALHPW